MRRKRRLRKRLRPLLLSPAYLLPRMLPLRRKRPSRPLILRVKIGLLSPETRRQDVELWRLCAAGLGLDMPDCRKIALENIEQALFAAALKNLREKCAAGSQDLHGESQSLLGEPHDPEMIGLPVTGCRRRHIR